MEWRSAIEKASADYRAGRISGVSHRKKKVPKRGKSKGRVGSAKPKYKCIHEVRKVSGVTYKGGSIQVKGVAEVENKKNALRRAIAEQLSWIEVALSSAKTQREKNALRKMKAARVRELNKISK